MSALKFSPSKIAETLQINSRFGSLLMKERKSAGHSLDEVAVRFGLALGDLKNWELGIASPAAKVFFAIVKFYGPAAYKQAAKLDLELQIEKYNLLMGASLSHSLAA